MYKTLQDLVLWITFSPFPPESQKVNENSYLSVMKQTQRSAQLH